MRTRDASTLWLPGVEWAGAALAREPADTEQRRRALDPDTSFIVQAPAGSGKTELLIQRFLVLLARVVEPEAIVAITFTVKAAGEMRARVLDALRSAARGVEPASAHERFSIELAQQALAQDARQGWGLLNNPSRLRIQTIDALSMGVTRQMPWLARFGAMPNVTDDAQQMYREAAGRGVEMLGGPEEEHAAAVARLLLHLDNDAARTAELLARMLETRDHWLRVMGHGGNPEARVRKVLETALQRIVCEHLTRLRASIPPQHCAELLELLRYAAGNVRETDPIIARCADLAALPEAMAESVDHWLGLNKLLLTGKGEWRKSPNRNQGFPPHNRRMKQRMDGLLKELAEARVFQELLANVTALPACAYEQAQWEVLSALFHLLPVTVAHLRAVFAEQGRVDFVEIASASLRALGDAEQPTDLALSMGSRIDHLLVDEFQDTSVTQFELLRALTAGWEDGARRTLFLVGDPMQSIYRFRQAEVALFLNVRASGLVAIHPEPLELSVNFRSARTVVDWVNDVFRGVFPAAADPYSGAVPYTPSTAFREGNAGAGVTVHPFAGRDDSKEADLVAELVQGTLREWPDRRTAILVRSRAHLMTIATCLRDRGVAYRAIEIQALAERPLIQDLLALSRALLHLGDRVAWLSILRAPWCGLTLSDLYRIAGADRDRTVWSLLHDPSLAIEPDGAQRLARVLPVLSRAIAARGRVPVAQLVERTWVALGGDRLVPAKDLEDARAFFDLLEEVGKDGDIGDLESLSRRAGELFANPDSEAVAVELMTIHKAKGLEFDTVILPGLGKRPRVDDSPLLLWSERPSANGTDLLMAPIAARRNGEDRTYAFIRREIDEKTRNESQRLLYVACTRARTTLHLIGHVEFQADALEPAFTDPPRDSLLAHIWPAVRPQFDELLRTATPAAANAAGNPRRPRMLSRVRLNELPVEAEVDMAAFEAAPVRLQEDVIATASGTITHRLLERIAREGIDKWNNDRIAGLRPALRIATEAESGVSGEEIEQACERIESALVRTIADARGRWALSPHTESRSEFAISGLLEGDVRHVVIDRTFVTEDGLRWIVDFKTSSPAPDQDIETFIVLETREYRPQLEEYARLVKRIDGRKIRLGLYFPMVGRWVEWGGGVEV